MVWVRDMGRIWLMDIVAEILAKKRMLGRIEQSRVNIQKKLEVANMRKRRGETLEEREGNQDHISWCAGESQRLDEAAQRIRTELERAKDALN